jgi:hypothetical protein
VEVAALGDDYQRQTLDFAAGMYFGLLEDLVVHLPQSPGAWTFLGPRLAVGVEMPLWWLVLLVYF